MMRAGAEASDRFRRIATAGIFFQGGAAAIDTGTIVATLVHTLTGGSALAVGAAAAIARAGWLVPQLFIGYIAEKHARRMPLYMLGAFGRAACLGILAGVLWLGARLPGEILIALFFAVWTIYSFMSGIVAVPYNDIVARSVPSERRSRLLALRFFGGGVLALIVAAAAHRLLAALPFHEAYAAVVLLGAVLLLGSAVLFVSAGEPQASAAPTEEKGGFVAFLYGGLVVLGGDRRFRLFVIAQLLGGVAAMALPFYILQAARTAGGAVPNAALLLGAQMAGALLSNPLWGWWGDRVGKASLLGLSSGLGVLPPALTLAWIGAAEGQGFAEAASLPWFAAVFALLGAAGSGGTIAQLGYLMEISPDDRRPAYSGYFNALIAPATLLPIAGGALAEATTLATVFAAGGVAAGLQVLLVRRLTALETGGER